MIKEKTCSKCSIAFSCGSSETSKSCWCNKYPPLVKPDLSVDCMCPACLEKATKYQIDQFISQMTIEKASTDNKAKDLPKTRNYIEGIDYYIQDSFWVFTSWHHLKRGYCCQNACRHCPYGFRKADKI